MTKEQKLAELMVHALVECVIELVVDRAKSADDVQEGVKEAMKVAIAGMNRLSATIGQPGERADASDIARNTMRPIFREIEAQALAGAIQARSKPKAH